jgi:hypothetical protein
MPALELEKPVFKILHQRITEKFERTCREQGLDIPTLNYQYYGYGKFDEETPSIASFMKKYSPVEAFLEKINEGRPAYNKYDINGKYLYDRLRDCSRKKKREIQLTSFYREVYSLYLDCQNFEEFRRRFLPKSDTRLYSGYYFAELDHEVRQFKMKIEFEGGGGYRLSIWRLYDYEGEKVYTGDGMLLNQCLYAQLKAGGMQDRIIQVVASVGPDFSSDREVVCLSLQTVGPDLYPISTQALLLNDHTGNGRLDEPHLELRRYTNLTRKNFRNSFSAIRNFRELRLPNQLHVNFLDPLVGTFRVWRLDEKGDIVQTRMEIKEDYSTFWYSKYYRNLVPEKQLGYLNVSTIFDSQLSLSFHPEGSTTPLSYAILKIPEAGNRLLRGGFCTLGPHDSEFELNKIFLLKERVARDDWSPCSLSVKEAKDQARQDLDVSLLWDQLNDFYDLDSFS